MTRQDADLEGERAGSATGSGSTRRVDDGLRSRVGGRYGPGRFAPLFLFSLAVLVLATGVGVGPVAAQEDSGTIGDCQELGNSTTYYLDGDIESDTHACLDITANDVTLDGQGHELRYTGGDDTAVGIEFQGDRTTIKNVTVVGWGDGIYGDSAQNAAIEDVVVQDSGRWGLRLSGTHGIEVRNSKVEGSAERGVRFFETDDPRLVDSTIESNVVGVLSHDSRNVTVEESTVTHNGVGIRGWQSDYNLVDVSAPSNPGHALELNESTADATSFDLGHSTSAGTTLDFSAENVWINATSPSSEPPENRTGIGRYFTTDEHYGDNSFVDVSLHYDPTDVYGVAESTLELWRHHGTDWAPIQGSGHDEGATAATATLNESTGFGEVGAFAEPVANYSVEIVDHNSPVTEGETLTVTANVTNVGEDEGNQTVELRVGNETPDETDLPLASGEAESIELEWPVADAEPGNYSMTVASENDTAEDTVSVLTPPEFVVDNFDADSTVRQGDALEVTANVTNVGEATGGQWLNLTVNGTDHGAEYLELDGGESQSVELTWNTSEDDRGDYELAIASADGEDGETVTVKKPAFVAVERVEAPVEVVRGEALVVNATLENEGDVNVTQNVTLDLGDESVDRVVTVNGTETKNVSLTLAPVGVDRGHYNASVASKDDDETANVTVLAPANLAIDALSTNSPVLEGEPLNVTASVTNTGDLDYTRWLNLTIDGTAVDARNVHIEGGASTNVTLQWIGTEESADEPEVGVHSEHENASTTVQVDAPPAFQVSIDGVDETVVEDESLNVTATVENVGDLEGTRNVTLAIDDGEDVTVVDAATVTLNGSEARTLDLAWTATDGEAGNYTATVDAGDGSDERAVTVQTPPEFEVAIDDTNAPVEAGDALTVDATVANVGEATGTATVELNVSGVHETVEREIDGGENETVTLSWSTGGGDAGNHTVTVSVGDDEATTDVIVEEADDESGGLPPDDGGDDGGLRIGIDDADGTVTVGDTVTVTATVTNDGDQAVTETIELTNDGARQDTETVTVAAGGSETVVLEWSTSSSDAGRERVVVSGDDDSASRWITVDSGPAVEVSILDTSSPVVEREPLEVTVLVEASEDERETVTLESPANDVVDQQTLDLSAGESRTITLVWETDVGDGGSRGFLTVESDEDAATRSVAVQPTPPFAVSVEDANSPVAVGENLTVDVEVTSEATSERRGYVTFAVGEEVVETRVLELEPEGAADLTLTWTPGADDLGDHTVTADVGADADQRSVTVANGSSGLLPFSPAWTETAVDYELSSQDTHVGAFFWLTLLVGGLGAYVLATRQTLDARVLGVTLLVAATRTGTDVLHATVGGTALEPLLALNTALELYVGLLFLAFAATYVEHDLLLEERSVMALLGVAATGTLAIVTNPVHGLVFSGVSLAESAPFTYVTADTGALGWAILSVTLVSLLFAAGLLVQSFLDGTDPAWRPVGVLASGLLLALLVVALSVLERGPLPHYDYTGAGVAGFLALTTTTLFGHGLQRIKHNAQQSLIEDLEDPIVIANDQRVVVEFNDAAAELLPGIATGTRFDRLVAYDPAWPAPGTTETTEQSRSGMLPTRSAPASDAETIVPAEPGSEEASVPEVHYLVQTTSVTADTGDTIGFTVRFTDVTELKRRTNELSRKNAQLEQVASTISHDLRNPLSVADGYVDIARDGVPVDADAPVRPGDVEQHLGPVRRAVDRMEAIIDDILALARSAEAVSTTEAVEYDELVEEAWHTVDTDEATLFIESTGLIDADGQRLRRILENLFRNAVEHAGEDVAIVTGITEEGFYVADDGPGIPPEQREEVFAEGYTSAADGTGLGLAIVRQLAEAHDWTVEIDPEYEEGARFDFSGATTMAHRDGPISAAIEND